MSTPAKPSPNDLDARIKVVAEKATFIANSLNAVTLKDPAFDTNNNLTAAGRKQIKEFDTNGDGTLQSSEITAAALDSLNKAYYASYLGIVAIANDYVLNDPEALRKYIGLREAEVGMPIEKLRPADRAAILKAANAAGLKFDTSLIDEVGYTPPGASKPTPAPAVGK